MKKYFVIWFAGRTGDTFISIVMYAGSVTQPKTFLPEYTLNKSTAASNGETAVQQ